MERFFDIDAVKTKSWALVIFLQFIHVLSVIGLVCVAVPAALLAIVALLIFYIQEDLAEARTSAIKRL